MEFLIVSVIVAILGGVLGYFVGKKTKPVKNHSTEGLLVGLVLGILLTKALDLPLYYGACIGVILGELIGLSIPKKRKIKHPPTVSFKTVGGCFLRVFCFWLWYLAAVKV